ncbi:30S ribosomal protein S7 [Candidatus Pacearchaeota archaeon]|nr:30S ribosomal protein S7 [Candidatus Pacearchaeota archaeon]
MSFKIFDLYDMDEVKVNDKSLAPYLNIQPKLLIKSHGRNVGKFTQTKVHILERLANRLAVPGHVGKKHKIITSHASGKYNRNMTTILSMLKIVAEKKKTNPLQVLITAIENASPRDEITTIEYGGARYPQAVDVSPMRRINLVIRWMIQGSFQKSFGKKRTMAESLALEIINASEKNMESYALNKKNESEKQADSAR